MEQRYRKTRKNLDRLGYMQVLSPDAVPLVEALVLDLVHTTENMEKYKKLSADALQELHCYHVDVKPVKCDSVKLVHECNDLHLKLSHLEEENDKLQKNLQKSTTRLTEQKIHSDSEREKLQRRIAELELKGTRSSGPAMNSFSMLRKSSRARSPPCCNQKARRSVDNAKLRDEQSKLSEVNDELRKQLNGRDKQIERLSSLLAGSVSNVQQDTTGCYRDIETTLKRLSSEVVTLEKDKSVLQDRLRDALDKQHEAMKRALALAEKNKQLEKEMRDIDHIALAVEEECNSTAKNNATKLYKSQEKLREVVQKAQELEREMASSKSEKRDLLTDFDALKLEKRHLQNALDSALEDKKELSEKINQFLVIENDLNLEIDRLSRLTGSQKCKIAELECKVLTMKREPPTMDGIDSGENCALKRPTIEEMSLKERLSNGESRRTSRAASAAAAAQPDHPKYQITRECRRQSGKDARNRESEELGNVMLEEAEPDYSHVFVKGMKGTSYISTYKSERDHYKREYERMAEMVKSSCCNDTELSRKLKALEQQLSSVQHENKALAQEKHNLMVRLEAMRDAAEGTGDIATLKNHVKRLEREREMLKTDLVQVEAERENLQIQLKALSDTQRADRERVHETLTDSEEQIRHLQRERRDLMHEQGSRKATIIGLEDQRNSLKERLNSVQTEMNHQRNLSNQLKVLNEQTDKALAEASGKLLQSQTEIATLQQRVSKAEQDRRELENCACKLKNDLAVAKGSLARVDRERDELVLSVDSKTEKIVSLETELKSKCDKSCILECNVAELQRRLSSSIEAAASKEQLLKATSMETVNMKRDLENAIRQRELAYKENRRLQDELARLSVETQQLRSDKEACQKQTEDLKKELKQYVAEVKRFEDLLTSKEMERNELFDQFKSLSHEATTLETNNHSLENAAAHSKLQLSVALEHVTDLERKVDSRDTLIVSYEKQIEVLSAQVASLEMQLAQSRDVQERKDNDLTCMRGLCKRMDANKESLNKEVEQRQVQFLQMQDELERLRQENQSIKMEISREKATRTHIEKLLSDAREECVQNKLRLQDVEAELSRVRSQEVCQASGSKTGSLESPSPYSFQNPNFPAVTSEASATLNISCGGMEVSSFSYLPPQSRVGGCIHCPYAINENETMGGAPRRLTGDGRNSNVISSNLKLSISPRAQSQS